MEKKKGIIEDLYEFLRILAENSRGYIKRENDFENHKKRSEKELSKKFGEEKVENLIDLCFEQRYIRRERVKGIPEEKGFEEDFYSIKIQGKGLKYLEEFEREKRKENNSRRNLISNYILSVATVILVLITAFYAGQTWELNKISYQSFESENRPYFYVESINLIKGVE